MAALDLSMPGGLKVSTGVATARRTRTGTTPWLAEHLGATGEVETTTVCVDRGRQWSRSTNIWHNAGIRSGSYMTGVPIRLFARPFRRGG